MRRPRFAASQPDESATRDTAFAEVQPDAETLLREIDAGIATVEATLADLEQESAQYRHRLAQISGAATLFDEAGLVTEATVMHDGEHSIAAALAENERRRTAMIETAQKLHLARQQMALTQPEAVALLAETTGEQQPAQPIDVAPEAAAAASPDASSRDEPSAAALLLPTNADPAPASASESIEASVPEPVAPVEWPVVDEGQSEEQAVVDAPPADPHRWRRELLAFVGIALLLSLLLSGTILAASRLGGDDDDEGASVSQPTPIIVTQPAAALVQPSPTAANLTQPTAPVTVLSTPTPLATLAPDTMTTAPPVAMATTPTLPSATPTAVAQPTAIELGTVVDRVVDAEAALRAGQLDATVEYPDGTTSSTSIRFDFGASDGVTKVDMLTTYQSGGQTRTTEQIMIGTQIWQRVDGGGWQPASNVEGVWGQIQAFLPRLATVAQPQREDDGRPGELHWYDSARNADVTLQADAETGQPARMQVVSRGTDSALTIVYTGWNVPTQIEPPVS